MALERLILSNTQISGSLVLWGKSLYVLGISEMPLLTSLIVRHPLQIQAPEKEFSLSAEKTPLRAFYMPHEVPDYTPLFVGGSFMTREKDWGLIFLSGGSIKFCAAAGAPFSGYLTDLGVGPETIFIYGWDAEKKRTLRVRRLLPGKEETALEQFLIETEATHERERAACLSRMPCLEGSGAPLALSARHSYAFAEKAGLYTVPSSAKSARK